MEKVPMSNEAQNNEIRMAQNQVLRSGINELNFLAVDQNYLEIVILILCQELRKSPKSSQIGTTLTEFVP